MIICDRCRQNYSGITSVRMGEITRQDLCISCREDLEKRLKKLYYEFMDSGVHSDPS